MKYQRIFLTGFMGAGKSTVAKLLAEHLESRCVDTDTLVEQCFGMRINAMFAHFGEGFFRDCESSMLKHLCQIDGNGFFSDSDERVLIVATGGGAVIRAQNRKVMRDCGVRVYLHAPWTDIKSRLSNDSDRPLACKLDMDMLYSLWQKRLPWYKDADIIVETESLNADEVARKIISSLGL